ncbi:unnamed protein product, partial [Mesorhabditis spiculigera]
MRSQLHFTILLLLSCTVLVNGHHDPTHHANHPKAISFGNNVLAQPYEVVDEWELVDPDEESFYYDEEEAEPGCLPTEDGEETYECPRDKPGEPLVCIHQWQFCDRILDCPNGKDEPPLHCLFKAALDEKLMESGQRTQSLFQPHHRLRHHAPADIHVGHHKIFVGRKHEPNSSR